MPSEVPNPPPSSGVALARYLLGRATFLVAVVWAWASLVFVLLYVWPLDPATMLSAGEATDVATLRTELGLNRPLPAQYLDFLRRTLTFRFEETWVLGPDGEPDRYVRAGVRATRTLFVTALAAGVATLALRSWPARADGDGVDLRGLAGRAVPAFLLGDAAFALVLYDTNLLGVDWSTVGVDTARYGRFAAEVRPPPVVVADPGAALVALKWYLPAGAALGFAMAGTYGLLRRVALAGEAGTAHGYVARAVGVETALSRNVSLAVAPLLPALAGVYLGMLVVVESLFEVEGLGGLFVTALQVDDVPVVASVTVAFVAVLAAATLLRDAVLATTVGPPGDGATAGASPDPDRDDAAPTGETLRPLRRGRARASSLLARVRADPRPAVAWVAVAALLVGLELPALARTGLEVPPWNALLGGLFGVLADLGGDGLVAPLRGIATAAADAAGAVGGLPTPLSRGVVPNGGYWTGAGYAGTFLGLEPALAWAVRVGLIYLYAAVLAGWAVVGYRLYRTRYRLAERTATDRVLARLRSDRLAVFGAVVVFAFVVFAVFAPAVGPATGPRHVGTQQQNDYLKQTVRYYDETSDSVQRIKVMFADEASQSEPTVDDTDVAPLEYDDYGRFHPFGTDLGGRDLFTRMAFAARTYLALGVLATGLAAALALGAAALPAAGGDLDRRLRQVTDALGVAPTLPLALTVGFAFRPVGIGDYWGGGVVLAAVFGGFLWVPLWGAVRGAANRAVEGAGADPVRVAGGGSRTLLRRRLLPAVAGRLGGYALVLFSGVLVSAEAVDQFVAIHAYLLDTWTVTVPRRPEAWWVIVIPTVAFGAVLLGFAALGTAVRRATGTDRDEAAVSGELAGAGAGG